MDYADLRLIHITCVALSLSGFVLRGFLLLTDSPWLQHRITRTLPHINDTLLLSAAIALSVLSGQYPWQQAWLGVKIAALLAYIALGFVVFRFGRSKRQRITAWGLAIVIFLWMLTVARLHHPLGIFSLLM